MNMYLGGRKPTEEERRELEWFLNRCCGQRGVSVKVDVDAGVPSGAGAEGMCPLFPRRRIIVP